MNMIMPLIDISVISVPLFPFGFLFLSKSKYLNINEKLATLELVCCLINYITVEMVTISFYFNAKFGIVISCLIWNKILRKKSHTQSNESFLRKLKYQRFIKIVLKRKTKDMVTTTYSL